MVQIAVVRNICSAAILAARADTSGSKNENVKTKPLQ